MKIRFGYVAIALKLPKVTSSSALTYSRYQKLMEQERINELKRVTRSNMEDLIKIFKYNIENHIEFYRISSKLIPLATHPEVVDWKYRTYFKLDFKVIGKMIKDHHMRVDTHPDHFNVLNSTKEEVVKKTHKELFYHNYMFEDMDYPEGKMILHIGSAQGGKDQAIERFIKNFNELPKEIQRRIILENDDKTFTAQDVLKICQCVGVPMVLDVHHHLCNDGGVGLDTLIKDIFKTWDKETLPPKIHLSSPKDGEKDKKHADYIRIEDFLKFIDLVKEEDTDIDIMIEAKKKDLALYQLVENIKKERNYLWKNNTIIEI